MVQISSKKKKKNREREHLPIHCINLLLYLDIKTRESQLNTTEEYLS